MSSGRHLRLPIRARSCAWAVDLAFEELGALNLKNIEFPVEAFVLRSVTAAMPDEQAIPFKPPQFQVHSCRTPDGVRLAYAKVGDGPVLVTAGHWMTHMHYGWENPIRRGAWQRLRQGRQHIFYDWRGCGLSE